MPRTNPLEQESAESTTHRDTPAPPLTVCPICGAEGLPERIFIHAWREHTAIVRALTSPPTPGPSAEEIDPLAGDKQ